MTKPPFFPQWVTIHGVLIASIAAAVASTSLEVYPPEPAAPSVALEPLSSVDGLSHDAVHAIVQDRHGFLWLGTEDGLNRYDGREFVVYRHAIGDAHSLGNNFVTTLCEQRGALLWVGTAAGLYRLRPDRESFEPEDLAGRPQVFDLLQGEDGALWIATDQGLYRRDLAPRQVPLTGSRPDPRTTALEMDAVGNVWALTQDAEDRTVLHRLSPDGSNSKAFPLGAQRTTFLVSASGEMWFDLEGPIDERDFPLAPVAAERLPTVFAADHEGRTWIGTAHGLYINDGSAGSVRQVGAEGQATGEVLAAYRDRTGRLWFGTRQGVLYGGPIAGERQAPPLVLTGLSVHDETGERRTAHPPLAERLELGAGARGVAFEFVGIEFDRSREVRYRHRLDGLDTVWTDNDTRRYARYTNLPPGDYRFRVQASSDGTFRDASETALAMTVRAPFHTAIWFRGGMLLLLAGLLFAGYRLRIRRLRAAQRARLTILRKLHDELDASLARIAAASGTVHDRTYLRPDDREQLAEAHLVAGRLRESIRDIEWYVDPEQDTLASVAARMRSAADTMLKEIEHELRLPGTNETIAVGLGLRRQLFIIFMELLRNIVQHAAARRVVVDLRVAGGILSLEVSDDGAGFDPGVESGGGLEEIRRRAARAGADLTIQSEPGGGTRVRLELPLGNETRDIPV